MSADAGGSCRQQGVSATCQVWPARAGFLDPKIRLSVNLYGAPALTLQQFKYYEQDLIIGASVQVSVPRGQYDDTRAINLGTNRWSVKPELGVSQIVGPWTLELGGAADFERRRSTPAT